jgi:tetratricopeptide (TPR) repeat protein
MDLASSAARMRIGQWWAALAALGCLCGTPQPAAADDGSALVLAASNPVAACRIAPDLVRQAMAECEAGRRAEARTDRQGHFERGAALAERAVAQDDGCAQAHFAVFCNRGELMRIDGERISSVFSLRQLLAELDRTLALDPRHSDAMAAKGTFLLRLPRLLGGDMARGEALLREAIRIDPNAFSSRLTLARACDARGDHEEALAYGTRALQIAREQGRADKIAQAQALLAELHAGE